jgi:hypothetical protein
MSLVHSNINDIDDGYSKYHEAREKYIKECGSLAPELPIEATAETQS